jgi:hypothetical protein
LAGRGDFLVDVKKIIANIDYIEPKGLDKKFKDGMDKRDAGTVVSKYIPKDSDWQPSPVAFKDVKTDEVDWTSLKDDLAKGIKSPPLKGKITLVG